MKTQKLISVSLLTALVVLSVRSATAQQGAATTSSAGPGTEVSVQLQELAGQQKPPATITLADAIARARKYDSDYLAAVGASKNSHQDALQARNAMLPQASALSQYLGVQGNGNLPNGTPSGRFVTQDGVHVYRAWGVFRQDLSPTTYLGTGYHQAQAAEALAKAKAQIAQLGLTVTVTKNYYGLAAAQRKYASTEGALAESRRFLKITQDSETAGQAAHADVLKAQIQAEQLQQAFDEAALAVDTARLTLAVMLSPTLDENFTVVDDLDTAAALPDFSEMQDMAAKQNPNLRVAIETERQASIALTAAKGAFLPSFNIETDYGIEANAFALRSKVAADPAKGPLPNLGYFITAGVTIPVWDWGTLRSKLHQAETNREQAQVELSQSQREALAGLYSAYNEVTVARGAVDSSHRAADDASESLRLVNLRYQAGESTALEVVDAQNTVSQARNAYADAQVRLRVAIASLQTLTGPF